MAFKITPTKANLIKVQTMLHLMQSSYSLLDKKRVVLLREANRQKKRREELESKLGGVMASFFEHWDHSTITLGHYQLESIAAGMPVDESLEMQVRSQMGVEVAQFRHDLRKAHLEDFETVHLSLDFARTSMEEMKELLLELASVVDASARLDAEMMKTQKRANALEKVQIPKYTRLQGIISQALEEKEREEFFRLKLLKKKQQRKKTA